MRNRYERRSRPVPIAPVIGLAILAAGLAYAQQNVPVPPAATPPAATPPATAPAKDAAAESPPTAGTAGATNPSPTTGAGSPQRFEPTEKVRPDFDVAFPVDI